MIIPKRYSVLIWERLQLVFDANRAKVEERIQEKLRELGVSEESVGIVIKNLKVVPQWGEDGTVSGTLQCNTEGIPVEEAQVIRELLGTTQVRDTSMDVVYDSTEGEAMLRGEATRRGYKEVKKGVEQLRSGKDDALVALERGLQLLELGQNINPDVIRDMRDELFASLAEEGSSDKDDEAELV